MRRTVTRALVVGALAVGLCTPLAAPAVVAQETSTEAWATIGATHPAPGCSVNVSFEVRSDGGPNVGADVSLSLSEDGTSNVISSDRQVTDGSGVAYLTFDTSAAGAGDKLWLEFHVNGVYVGGESVWADGSDCSSEATVASFNGAIPSSSGESADTSGDSGASSDATSSGAVMIPNVSAYQQQRGLSCEYASLSIATGALGSWISEWSFDAHVPLSDNPHWGYRGNINGQWGNTTDYGVYAEPLVPALAAFGFTGEVFYGGTDTLKAHLAAGHPVVVWLALWGDTSTHETTADGTTYQLTAGEHVMTAYGYDESGVYLSDPGTGKLRFYDWGTFTWMWSIMDEMALAVHW